MGLSPNEVLDLELYQFNIYVKGYDEKKKEQQKELISLAWHFACFNNQKKLKSLDSYLSIIDSKNIQKSDKEKQLEDIKHAKELDKKRGDM